MMKKLIKICILVLVILIFSLPSFAKDIFITSQSHSTIDDIQVLERNYFNNDDYVIGDELSDNIIVLLGKNNELIYKTDMGVTVTRVPFFTGIGKILVFKKNEFQLSELNAHSLISKDISFCDNDGVCEPCFSGFCFLTENVLTCPDCPSGFNDGYCDLKKDGVCDPDCENQDGDCSFCEPFCAFENITCSDKGGTFCSSDEECVGGYFSGGIFNNDLIVDNCCINGFCGNSYASATLKREIIYFPEYFDLNVSETPVESCSSIGGITCDCTAECVGEWIYTNEELMCCSGSCFNPSTVEKDEFISEEEEALITQENIFFNNDPSSGLTEEEKILLQQGNLTISSTGQIYENIEDIDPDYLKQKMDFAEAQDPEYWSLDFDDENEQTIEELRESELYILGFEPLTFFIALATIIILIVGLLTTFIIKERKSPTPAVKSNENLQSDIDGLISQNLNYQQIQNILVQKGFAPALVNQEIKKNYYKRKGQ